MEDDDPYSNNCSAMNTAQSVLFSEYGLCLFVFLTNI